MDVKDYCKNMSMELTGWKAKMYDVVRKMDTLSTGEKAKFLPNVNEIHMLIEEIDDRIISLERSCPTSWKPDEEEINRSIAEIKTKVKGVWDPLSIGK